MCRLFHHTPYFFLFFHSCLIVESSLARFLLLRYSFGLTDCYHMHLGCFASDGARLICVTLALNDAVGLVMSVRLAFQRAKVTIMGGSISAVPLHIRIQSYMSDERHLRRQYQHLIS